MNTYRLEISRDQNPIMINTGQHLVGGPHKSLDQKGFEAAVAAHERFLRGMGGSRAVLRFMRAHGLRAPRRLLNDVDFTGADFTAAVFAGCHFERASLHCADLSGCDL